MIIGGTTSALLSLLDNLDYEYYEVDLILFFSGGEFFDQIPTNVNVTILIPDEKSERLFERKKRHSIKYITTYLYASVISKIHDNDLILGQIASKQFANLLPKQNKEYDVAFSFIEFIPAAYVAYYVHAKKKATWLHLDYKEAQMMPNVENKIFDRMDFIYFVSESCLSGFKDLYPQYIQKTHYLENIVDDKKTIKKSCAHLETNIAKKIDKTIVNVVSCSRIVFEHKGYDRAVRVFERIKKERGSCFHWYVIGEGCDLENMNHMIKERKLEEDVDLLGAMINPFPLIRNMDLFLLPSRREGKPIAVTEALQLGVPVLVTKYQSAGEQIQNGVDGMIVDNSEEDLYQGLTYLLTHRSMLENYKDNISRKRYVDFTSIEKINQMVLMNND